MLAAASGQPEPTPLTGYIVSLVYSWTHVYPEVAAAPALTSIALEKIAIVTQECIPVIAAAYSDQPLTAYVEAAVLMQTPWSDLLERNAAGRQSISAPVLVVQGGGPTGSRRHDRGVGPPVVSARDRCATQALSRGGPWCGHCRGDARHAGVGHRPDGRETGRLDVLIVRGNSKSLLAQTKEPILRTEAASCSRSRTEALSRDQ